MKKHSLSLSGYKIKEDRVLENYNESQDDDDTIFEISAAETSADGKNLLKAHWSRIISNQFNLQRL